jgi:hypothetical protein
VCGRLISTVSAPSARSQARPCSHSASISGGVPSSRYSFGTPILSPFTPRAQAAAKSGTGISTLVLSFGSKPDMDRSRIAQSSTVRATGPAWSSEEAKATTPQRLHRP